MGEATTNKRSEGSTDKNPWLTGHKSIESSSEESDSSNAENPWLTGHKSIESSSEKSDLSDAENPWLTGHKSIESSSEKSDLSDAENPWLTGHKSIESSYEESDLSDAENSWLTGHTSIESSSEESDLSDFSGLTEKQKQIRAKLFGILDELKESFRTYESDFFEGRFGNGEQNNIECLKSFLEAENSEDIKIVLNFSDENVMTILHDVTEFHDGVTELLLGAGANPNIQDIKGKTPLHYATEFKCFGGVEMLLGAGANPDIPDNDGKTPLQMATDLRCYNAVGLFFDEKLKRLPDKQKKLNEELYELLCEINYSSTREKYDSEYTIDNDNIKDLKEFLKKENSEDLQFVLNLRRGEFGSTLLHNPQSLFYTETLNLLLDAGADLNIQDIDGKTPLHIAAQYGYQESAKLLLRAGADPNIEDIDGNTPFRLSIMSECLDIIQFFLENNETNINFPHERTGETPIFDAIEGKANGENIADIMIKSGKKVALNIKNANGVTVLHRAASIGQRGAIQLLLKQGASVSAIDDEGNNPLHYIIYNNHKFYGADNKDEKREFNDDNSENIIAMISSFINYHVKDHTELIDEKVQELFQTIDDEAYDRLHREICNLELKRAAKAKEYVNTRNHNGNTPLFFAVESGKCAVIETLLKEGAAVAITDKNGYTPFHYAVKSKDPKILKLLISSITNSEITQEKFEDALNAPSHMKSFSNLLWYSISSSIKDKILDPILLHHTMNIDIDAQIEAIIPDVIKQNKKSYNAVKGELSEIIKSAVEKTHEQLSVCDNEGNTLLHHAVKWGCSEEILDFLVRSGVDVNAKNKHGVAAIHIAAKYGSSSQMEFLIKNGADYNVRCGNFTKAETEILENHVVIVTESDGYSSVVTEVKNDAEYADATPRALAACSFRTDAEHELALKKAKVNVTNSIGAPLLHIVAARIINKDYEEHEKIEVYKMFERLIDLSTNDLLWCKNFIEIFSGNEKEEITKILDRAIENSKGGEEPTSQMSEERSSHAFNENFYHEIGSHIKEVPDLCIDTAYNKLNGMTSVDHWMNVWDLQADHNELKYQERTTTKQLDDSVWAEATLKTETDRAVTFGIEKFEWGEPGDIIPEASGAVVWNDAPQKGINLQINPDNTNFEYSESDKAKSADTKSDEEPITNIKQKAPNTRFSDVSTQKVRVEERSHLEQTKLIKREELKLNKFLYLVSKAQNMLELYKIVDEALKAGVRINCAQGNKDTFANVVLFKASQLKLDPKIASGIVCKLVSKGAVSGESYNKINYELKKSEIFADHEVNLQKATKEFSKRINEFQRVIGSAISQGKLNKLNIDHTTFYLEYSEDSIIDVTKVINGAESLGESGGGIVKIGENEIEIEVNNGIKNYANFSGNGCVILTLMGLEVTLYNDLQNKDRVIVEVSDNDRKKLDELSDEEKKKVWGKYQLGRMPICDAIKQGYFERSCSSKLQASEIINLSENVMDKASEIVKNLDSSDITAHSLVNSLVSGVQLSKIATDQGKSRA
ncbi:ankyrin repeat domain-containing protein [Wolbachia endosymbiont of Folsomia candida]|uniref:ankyrin repeat domain-containing protein n=1 Tax=Wolbachia endosymbiont of Folsomia candida TaxID=169402 RepID=UPI000AAE4814|nr:ankyrin repeat domain-containing protein [Wolbachia endosymbiont of Folsomia candida]APR98104.1 hypothetical protein ASM33_02185 [Wolbachia endosymbiont of Folsomia candida]